MHKPVLNQEILEAFDYLKDSNGFFIDGTLGYAGHSIAIITKLSRNLKILGIDKDETALSLSKERVQKLGLSDNFVFVKSDFKQIKQILQEKNISKIKGALLDLGVSSMQLDERSRGFSFQAPEANLDMRMDRTQSLNARAVLNTYPQNKLEEILRVFGEEKFAKKIAEKIVAARKTKPFSTVLDLLAILEAAIPAKERFGRSHHFATKTFQALRIEVNGELKDLETAILEIANCLEPQARLAVISFHSIEDRIVKNAFRELENPCHCPPQLPCICGKTPLGKIITKKPITAKESEVGLNPRSRSAKLRIFERI